MEMEIELETCGPLRSSRAQNPPGHEGRARPWQKGCWGRKFGLVNGLVSPRRVERPAAPPTRPGSLGNELLGVRWVLVCRRVHALCLQGCGGGAPSLFRNFHGEGGSLRHLMSARKMCICSHFGRGALYALLCLLGKCVSVRTRMEKAY